MKIILSIIFALLSLFCLTGCAALGQSISTRGAVIGGIGGYYGWTALGKVSSESEAASLARSKGYSNYMYDSATGLVMGK